MEGGKVLLARVMAILHHRLIACRAGIPCFLSGHLPDYPVGRFDKPVRGLVNLRCFLQDLQGFAEKPFRRDFAPISIQPAFTHLAGCFVYLVGLGLAGMVLPQLDPGMRIILPFVKRP